MTTALLVVFVAAAAGETLFCLFYGFLLPWYKTEIGRQMLIYSAVVAALMDFGLITRFWPHLVPREAAPWLFVGGYGAFAALIWWRTFILVRLWWQEHRNSTPL